MLTAPKLIVCILPKGKAKEVLLALKTEHGVVTANVNNARGVGRLSPLSERGVGEQTEKEMLKVVSDSEHAEDLFSFIYDKADIDRPHGGLMYIYPLHRATLLELPDLPEEE